MVFNKHFLKHFAKVLPTVLCGMIIMIAADFLYLKLPEYTGAIVNAFKRAQETGLQLADISNEVYSLIIRMIITLSVFVILDIFHRLFIFGPAFSIDHGIRWICLSTQLNYRKAIIVNIK